MIKRDNHDDAACLLDLLHQHHLLPNQTPPPQLLRLRHRLLPIPRWTRHHGSQASQQSQSENSNNESSTAPTTPSKSNKDKPKEEEVVLSPTPYHKVWAERGGKSSPAETRSAKKKKMIQNLNELDATLSPDQNNEGLSSLMKRGGLRFESPSAFCAEHHVPSSSRQHAVAGERRNPLRDPSPARRVKKLKTNSGAAAGTNSNAAPSPSLGEMRQVITDALASDHHSKLMAALQENGALLQKYQELSERYEELERRYCAKTEDDEFHRLIEEERSKWEEEREMLEAKVVELREQNVGYVEQLTDLEEKCKAKNATAVESGEWEKKYIEQAGELQGAQEALAKVEGEMEEMVVRLTDQEMELEETKAELMRVQEVNEEQANVLEEAQGALEEANQRAQEMEKMAADAGAATELVSRLQEEKAALAEELNEAKSDVESKVEVINKLETTVKNLETAKNDALDLATDSANRVNQLEQSLEVTTQDLESARQALSIAKSKLDGVQSPRSRSAVEEQHHQEVSLLQNRVSTLESRLGDKEKELAGMAEDSKAIKEELQTCRDDCEGLASELEAMSATQSDWSNQRQEMEAQLRTVRKEKADADILLEELDGENKGLMKQWEDTKTELANSNDEVAELSEKLAVESTQKQQVEDRLTRALEDIAGLEANVSSLSTELTASQQLVSSLQQEKYASDAKIAQLSQELASVNAQLQNAKAEISSLRSQLQSKQVYCDNFEKTERELLQDIHRLNEIRRCLHNRCIQLSGNIRVFVRVRPPNESELQALTDGRDSNKTGSRPSSCNGPGSRPSSRDSSTARKSSTAKLTAKKAEVQTDISPFHFPAITADRSTNANKNGPTSYSDLTKQTIVIKEPYKDRGGLSERQKTWKYGFDRVFQPSHVQDDIWEGAEPLVQSCLDGYNVCMFAYGQTGSGKTHTMIGTDEHQGLIPRSVQLFFDTKADIERKCRAQDQDVDIQIEVELLEIYNEEVRDLLSPNAGNDGKLIKVDLNSHDAVGNVVVSASSKQDVDNILRLAQSRRCVKSTNSNAESSRSHMLFTIHFKVSSNSNEELARDGCLHIIDLAGSERVSKSGSVGTLLTEAKHINKSLLALTGVIEKLQSKADHVNYRDSKLTYLLRNSLGGDSKTLAIVCCSPQQEHFTESLSSIRFGAKASRVELKKGNEVDV
ncbi:hypothetical protein ACHAXN_004850 [Cyclotella atomus]